MTFGQRPTVGGYLCEEVTSALQKCIRRGDLDGALFWATELDLSGFGEYVWKRLRIIASEDVGPADHQIAPQIRALYANWFDQRKKDDSTHAPERLFLVHAVWLLVEAPKSRAIDHALIVHYEGPREKREIPDFALDKHTGRGRRMRRGHRHFWDEGAKVRPERIQCADPYGARAQQIRVDPQRDLPL